MRRRSIVLLPVLAALVAAAPAHAAGELRPGDLHETSLGFCTLNFVFDGPGGATLFGTAAHCVGSVGETVSDIGGDPIGKVAFIGKEDDTETDFAFIKVDAGRTGNVKPGVRGHRSYPTGVTGENDTAFGDLLQISGHGLGFHLTRPTRERRQAFLMYDDASIWTASGPLINGDSGGPIVHIDTGKALGMESRLCIGVCTDEGPTVEGIVRRASGAGFPVSLRTAP